MKIAIVAATSFEIEPLITHLRQQPGSEGRFHILITGVGLLASTYRLTTLLRNEKPDCVIQAGIAGCFEGVFSPGDLVMVKEECIGDLGVAENNGFNDVFDMGLLEASALPFSNKRLLNPDTREWERFGLPFVSGITVNEITTNPDRISLLRKKYNCDIETMEGAALHYACLLQGVSFIQLRSISNYLGERNKKNWRLAESIEILNNKLIEIIQEL